MILAVDVAYQDTVACAAGVLFRNWTDASPQEEIIAWVENIQDYVPGQFYRRELPCILTVLNQLEQTPDFVVIDGFVYLGQERRPGLGMHLYNEFGAKVCVIGVAKKPFRDTPPETELYRGESKSPLYVTAVGINGETAKAHIAEMHGLHRIPTLLKLVDQLCRSHIK